MKVYYMAIALSEHRNFREGDQLTLPHPTEKECLDYMIENFEGHLMFEVKKIYIIEEDNFVDSE